MDRLLNNSAASQECLWENEHGPPFYPLNTNRFHEVFYLNVRALRNNKASNYLKMDHGPNCETHNRKLPEEATQKPAWPRV